MMKILLLSVFMVPSLKAMEEPQLVNQENQQNDKEKWEEVEKLFEDFCKLIGEDLSEEEFKKMWTNMSPEEHEKKREQSNAIRKQLVDTIAACSEDFLAERVKDIFAKLSAEKEDSNKNRMRPPPKTILSFINIENLSKESVQNIKNIALKNWSDHRSCVHFVDRLVEANTLDKKDLVFVLEKATKLDREGKFMHSGLAVSCVKTKQLSQEIMHNVFELAFEEVNGEPRCKWIGKWIMDTDNATKEDVEKFWTYCTTLVGEELQYEWGALAAGKCKVDGQYFKTDKDLETLYNAPTTDTAMKKLIEGIAEERDDVARFLPAAKKPSDYKKQLNALKKWNEKTQQEIEKDLQINKLSKLYSYNQQEYNEELMTLTQKLSKEVQEKILPDVLNVRMAESVLEKDNPGFFDHSVMGAFFPQFAKEEVLQEEKPAQTVVNDWVKDGEIKEGKTMMSCPHNPIGYIVFLPKEPPKAMIIHVYGGWKKQNKDKNAYDDNPSSFDQKMLARGIAVIKLNLLDLYRNDNLQRQIEKDMFKDILNSIKFFSEKARAGELKEAELAVLKDIPQFLLGESFGGSTVTSFLQQHSGVVQGAISWNGGLAEADDAKDGYAPHLLPINEVKNKALKDPLLLLASSHDNRVTLSDSVTAFAEKAAQNGQGDKIATYVTRQSNIDSDESVYVGHYHRDHNDDVFKMIAHFILHNKKVMKESEAVNAYRLHMAKTYKRVTETNVSFQAEWLTYCLKAYETHLIKCKKQNKNKKSFEELWNTVFGPKLFETLIMREKLDGRSFAYKGLKISPQEKEIAKKFYQGYEFNVTEDEIKKKSKEICAKRLKDLGFLEDVAKNFANQMTLFDLNNFEHRKWNRLAKEKKPPSMQEQILGEAMGLTYFQEHKNDAEHKDMLEKAKNNLKTYFDQQDALLMQVFLNFTMLLTNKENVREMTEALKLARAEQARRNLNLTDSKNPTRTNRLMER